MSAVINSHYNVCTILLQLPHFKNTINDTNVNGDTALHFAFITKSEEIIQLLRLHGATLNTHMSAFRFIYQRFTPTRSSLLPTSCKAIPLYKRRRREQPFPHGKLTDGMTSRHKNIFLFPFAQRTLLSINICSFVSILSASKSLRYSNL
jgi:ankyrin repeat protein